MASPVQGVVSLADALATLGTEFSDISAFKVVCDHCREHWEVPVTFCVLYLAMVYSTRGTLPKHRYLASVDKCFAAWNLGLSLFSCWGFWMMFRPLVRVAASRGLQHTVCASTPELIGELSENPVALALSLFCLSKIPELGDTVFLILKCKRVRFLQWYHHTTVMLFCWLALATEYTPGIWFAVTNYFVHAVMYMYFFLMTFKSAAKFCKPVGPLITIIQITQMVWGLVVNAIAVGTYFTSGNCQIQAVTVYSAMVMYASYFYLFSQLYFEAKGTGKTNARKTARALSRKISQALLEDHCQDVAEGHAKAN